MSNEENGSEGLVSNDKEPGVTGKVILGQADADATCDVCNRVLPDIREGGIECHHDGTYTPLTPLGAVAEIIAWRKLGKRILGAPGILTGGTVVPADIIAELTNLVGHPTSDVPTIEIGQAQEPSKPQ